MPMLADTVTVSEWAHEAGADLIDVSSGGNVADAKITVRPGYQVPFAAEVRERTGIPTSAVGLITDPHLAEHIVTSGQADAVMAGREFLRDPHFALRAAHELCAAARKEGASKVKVAVIEKMVTDLYSDSGHAKWAVTTTTGRDFLRLAILRELGET